MACLGRLKLVMAQTLIDNYEWNFAWMLKFGIFAWDEKKDPDYRHFRPGCAVSLAALRNSCCTSPAPQQVMRPCCCPQLPASAEMLRPDGCS